METGSPTMESRSSKLKRAAWKLEHGSGRRCPRIQVPAPVQAVSGGSCGVNCERGRQCGTEGSWNAKVCCAKKEGPWERSAKYATSLSKTVRFWVQGIVDFRWNSLGILEWELFLSEFYKNGPAGPRTPERSGPAGPQTLERGLG